MSYEALAGPPRRYPMVGFLDEHPVLRRVLPSIVGGAIGFLAWRKHPILGLIDGAAVGRNVVGLHMGDVTPLGAVQSLGSHAIATASSLSLKRHPAVGYVAGAFASGILTGKRPSEMFGTDDSDIQRSLRSSGPTVPSVDYVPPKKAESKQTPGWGERDLPSDGRPAKGWSQARPDKMGPAITPESSVTESSFPGWKLALAGIGAVVGVVLIGTGVHLLAEKS